MAGMSLSQSSWVVPDLEDAMHRWVRLGVGPFYHFSYDLPKALYRGENVPLAMRVALAQAGTMQVELIQQTSDGPSCYRDTAALGETKFHHVCKITSNYEGDVRELRQRGIVIATEFEAKEGIPACYADTRDEIGCMLEFVADSNVMRALTQMIIDGAKTWRGEEPIRVGDEHITPYLARA